MYFAIVDMKRATGIIDDKVRPCLVLKNKFSRAKVMQVTSRSKSDEFHVHVNPYLVSGYVDVGTVYDIDSKFIRKKLRPCTTSEISGVESARDFTRFYKRDWGQVKNFNKEISKISVDNGSMM